MDAPIIFSAPMVRALLDGRKTTTRRLAWKLPGKSGRRAKVHPHWPPGMWPSQWQNRQPGDRLWVKERYAPKAVGHFYETDTDGTVRVAWNNPMFMPRTISRLTLIVAATKIERVQDISTADATAEGIRYLRTACYGTDDPDGTTGTSPQAAFAALWGSLHGIKSVNANPEVVVLSFTVHEQNIDAMPKAEAA